MIIRNAQVLTEDFVFEPRDIFIEEDRFASQAGGEVLDAQGLYAIPGLIDIHLHGCVGHDFCDGTPQAIQAIAGYLAANGITAFSPATMTLPEDVLQRVCETAAAYRSEQGAMLCGITMEGPFFHEKKKGGQNGQYLRRPDAAMFARLQKASGGMLRIACIAPELDGAMPFIEEVSQQCAVSIAHTTADYDTATKAFAAGASHVTHLFNAMPPFLHREPGVVGAAADAGATVEIICDGIHLHPSVVRTAYKIFGDDHIVLVSDSMMAAGFLDGDYSLGMQRVFVKDRRAVLEDGTIAGSTTNLMECVRHAVQFGLPLTSAVRMASANPARVIGQYDRMGSITPGKLANLVLLDQSLAIQNVWIGGVRTAR